MSVSPPPSLVVTCEHGGNRIPARYRPWFRGASALRALASHLGYDPGALQMARELGRRFGCPVLASTVSRLLVELNRSEHHPRLFSDLSRRLPRAEQERVLDSLYRPHRGNVESALASIALRGGPALHVASHSFTPVRQGVARRADVGFLYDPSRPAERRFASRWRSALLELRPDLRVRRNYPYRGSSDGLTTYLRGRLPRGRYLGIELEVSQKWFFVGGSDWAAMRRAIVDSLALTLTSS